jgi:hypothetical protein
MYTNEFLRMSFKSSSVIRDENQFSVFDIFPI